MGEFIGSRLSEIRSAEILSLVTELEVVCQVSSVPFLNMTLWHFLMQCVYPNGGSYKRQPIAAKFLPVDGFLGSTIRKLDGTDLFAMCEELARRNQTSLEFSLGQKLAGFLNASLPKLATPKRPSALSQRRESVVMRRRGNR